MVNANKCTQESILESLKSGKYYSTNGPEIHEININDSGCLQIKTSPVNIIRLAGPGGAGINVRGDELVDFAEFKIPDWKYIYIELVDKNNKKAITNNILY
jgi:hypothetical protein